MIRALLLTLVYWGLYFSLNVSIPIQIACIGYVMGLIFSSVLFISSEGKSF